MITRFAWAPEIAAQAKRVITIIRQSPRTFVDELDFKSSLGAHDQVVITDLGVLRRSGELVLEELHPGVTLEQAREATGWELAVADDLRTTEPPTGEELARLRELNA